jgi:hypothetical protein
LPQQPYDFARPQPTLAGLQTWTSCNRGTIHKAPPEDKNSKFIFQETATSCVDGGWLCLLENKQQVPRQTNASTQCIAKATAAGRTAKIAVSHSFGSSHPDRTAPS